MDKVVEALKITVFVCPHRKSANDWRDLYEEAGYFVSIVMREGKLKLYAWRKTSQQ